MVASSTLMGRSRLLISALSVVLLAAGTPENVGSASRPKIVFSRGNINVGTAIWTVNGDGSGLVQITRPPKNARDNEPAWSPDRRQIAFVRELVVGEDFRGDLARHEYLSVMRADGTALRRLVVHSHDPAWSPDGKRIAFVKHYAEDEEIWVMQRDGSGKRRLARGGHPAWSPDGRELAFNRWTGERYELFVMTANGGAERRLVPGFKEDEYSQPKPEWSPDGRRIAFADDRLYVVNRDGGGLTKLSGGASTKDASTPRWSADGSRILFERPSGGDSDSTFIIRVGGGRAQRVAMRTDYPVWSPDGLSIAFARGGRDLRVVDTSGGPSRRLAEGDARDLDW